MFSKEVGLSRIKTRESALKHDIRGFLATAAVWSQEALDQSINGSANTVATALVASQLAAVEHRLKAEDLVGRQASLDLCSVKNTLKKILTMYQPLAESKGISIIITSKECARPTRINYAESISLISNIIINALQSATSVIKIHINDADQTWSVAVENDGQTIPKDLADYLNGGAMPATYSREGLSIMRNMALSQRLQIHAKQLNQGTRIYLSSGKAKPSVRLVK